MSKKKKAAERAADAAVRLKYQRIEKKAAKAAKVVSREAAKAAAGRGIKGS